MKLTKFILVVVLCSLSFDILSQKYSGNSWKQVSNSGSGTLACIYYETPGLIFKNKTTGKMHGLCVDIIHDFANYLKETHDKTVEIRFVGQEQVFTEFLQHVKTTPDLLGISNVSITPERQRHYSFTPPFLNNIFVMLSSANAPTLQSLSEVKNKFSGYTALMISGSIHMEIMKNIKKNYYPELMIREAPSSSAILDELAKNPKLFTILDFTGLLYAIKTKLPVKRQNIEIPGPKDKLAFIMQKGSDWEPLWNEFLTSEYKSGVKYRKSIADNLGHAFLSLGQN